MEGTTEYADIANALDGEFGLRNIRAIREIRGQKLGGECHFGHGEMDVSVDHSA